MTDDPFPDPPPGLDAAVRAGLEADAARTDGRAGVGRRRGPPGRRPAGGRTGRAEGRPPGSGGPPDSPPWRPACSWPWQSGPTARGSRGVAGRRRPAGAGRPRRPADRCYTQTVELPPEARGTFPLLADGGLAARVWTRGDRFVVEPRAGGAWGREPAGGCGSRRPAGAAAGFREDELPAPVRQAVAVRGFEPRPLLAGLLADFDLAWTRPPASTPATNEVVGGPAGAGRGVRAGRRRPDPRPAHPRRPAARPIPAAGRPVGGRSSPST